MSRTGYQIALTNTTAALRSEMGMPHYRAKRDAAEKDIVDTLTACGCSVFRLNKPVDLLLGYRGVVYLAEIKTPGTHYGKKLNAAQQKFADTWRGSPVITLRTVDDALDFINRRCFS